MRHRSPVVFGFILSLLGLAGSAAAQAGPSPMILRATLAPDTGVLTITGTGLGADLVVSVEGQSVAVLPGATDTQLQVQAPEPMLTTPGTYRLAVVDPVRRVGDGFIVVSTTEDIAVAGAALRSATDREADPGAAEGRNTREPSSEAAAGPGPRPAGVSPNLVEGASNTAVGVGALAANTIGVYNTASGAQALFSNTSGTKNSAHGAFALHSNTSGTDNMASGGYALFSNTTGRYNTASGGYALNANTTGAYNTANGADSLYRNTTGERNTASGHGALHWNITGSANTATGVESLRNNQTGSYNTAHGTYALSANTTGVDNTASGYAALFSNTTGYFNTATGTGALYANTTGLYNTASGHEAMRFTTTGSFNVATGADALQANVTGNDNTATGVSALASSTASFNTAHGTNALLNTTTGGWNVGVGNRAGLNATTGSYNVYLGAEVQGTAADANTIRIGLPYSGGVGQNQTFIAGIHGTQLTGPAVQVFVDANGQLGTVTAPIAGTGTVAPSALAQQVQAQQETIADLRTRLARMEQLLKELASRR